jgi:antitoxin VapB
VTRADEVRSKLEQVRGWLEHNDLDAVLVSSYGGFAWLTAGGDNHIVVADEAGAASVLVTREDAYLLAANNDLRRIVDEQAGSLGLTPVDWPWYEEGAEGRVVDRLCDPSRSVSDLGRLGLPSAPPDLAELRYTLAPAELDRYRALGRDAAEALELAVLAARVGDRELDVAARIGEECARRAVDPIVVLVGADQRIADYRHPMPTDGRLSHTLLASVTARRHGLHASLSRMLHYGRAAAELLERHASVVRVDARLIAESQPGAALGAVFDRGVEQYGREGFGGEWRLHHQGGLTGYAGREIFATPASHRVLEAGQVVAWNPTITSVKSEDTVAIGDEHAEVLTRTPAWPHVAVELGTLSVERPALLVRE